MFILYLLMMVVMFCIAFIYHDKAHRDEECYETADSVGFALLISIPWIATIWFFVPYLFILWWTRNYSNK